MAGADINELAVLSPVEAQALALRGQAIFRALETMPKPIGGGGERIRAGRRAGTGDGCTMRVASPNAKLGQPEVKLGIVPGYGGTQRLPRLVGRGRALEMLLSGDTIDAAEAHRIGLVNYVVPRAELLAFCRAWLRKVLANGPMAVALTMEAVDVGLDSGLDEGLALRSRGVRAHGRHRRPARGHARVSRKAQAGVRGKIEHAEQDHRRRSFGQGLRFAIIVGRFNSFITDRLLAGALDALTRSGCPQEKIEIVESARAPGKCRWWRANWREQKRHDAIIALGAVIRGDTPHFDYVAGEAARGLAQVAAESGRAGGLRRAHDAIRSSRPSIARAPRAATRASTRP